MPAEYQPILPRDALLQQALQDHMASKDTLVRYKNAPQRTLEQLAGPLLEPMKHRVESLLDGLSHREASIRVAGLLLVQDHWPYLEELIPVCLNLAMRDPDAVVRGVAMDTIRLDYYGGVDDPTGLLGEVVSCWAEQPSVEGLASALMAAERIRIQSVRARREEWITMIGPLVTNMLHNCDIAEAKLRDPRPNVRLVALSMFTTEWHPTERAAGIAEKLLLEDMQQPVREAALKVINVYYSESNDLRIEKLLAGIVCDDSEPVQLRSAAYRGLFMVKGMPPSTWPAAVVAPGEFQFPAQVDWSFVNTFY